MRLGQEFNKRCDLLKYRVGLHDAAPAFNVHSVASRGRFFFSSDEVEDRLELLRKYPPGEADAVLREADEICGHRFRLLGYENLDFSIDSSRTGSDNHNFREIDWHFDPVHGKRAPLNPWYKILFLDFNIVGDHKVIWELNRHQHLVTLAKARLLSGDNKYARELIEQWRSWVRANPYPLGINWASSLEVAFRSLAWIWIDQLLAGLAEYNEFRAELVAALGFHGRYIERFLSTYFSPNTHLLGEAVALFFLGTLYPQMPQAERWKDSGWKIVLREAERQVRPDGVYFEQSLYYHVYALDFFLHARLLAARNEMQIPAAYDAVLQRMLDVIAALAQAGPAEGFGDDDGGRLFNSRRNRTEDMTDPLAIGAVMYSKQFGAAPLTEEAIWLFGGQAVDLLNSGSETPASVETHAFRDGGVFVMGDSEPFRQEVVVDAGPQGVGRSGHGHADALSLRLTMDGRRWLVDSGSGVYTSADPAERNRFRGTGAHNTLRVDGADQAIADGPFSWTDIPNIEVEAWIAGKTFSYFAGSHNGYARLADPVLHRRQVVKIAGGMCVVRDVAQANAEHDLEVLWHFAPALEVKAIGPGRVKVTEADGSAGDSELNLIMPEATAWQTEINPTLVSPAYGMLQAASLVRGHARVGLPAETATALLTSRRAVRSQDSSLFSRDTLRFASARHTAAQAYELTSRDEDHKFFFALGDEVWTADGWSSDARLLFCRIQKQNLAHLIVIGGTRVEWRGKPLMTMAQPFNFFEWRHGGAFYGETITITAPGEVSVTDEFKRLTAREPNGAAPAALNYISSGYAEKQ